MRVPLLARLGGLALLLVLAACSRGTWYDVPPPRAQADLGASELPLMLFGDAAVASEVASSTRERVTWSVLLRGDTEAIRLTARLTPEGKGTRIAVDVAPPGGPLKAQVARGIAANPSIAGFYRSVAAEHVDATLRHRPFDFTRVAGAMYAAMAANMGRISEQVRTDADGDEDRAPVWPRSDMPRFGEPMDEAEARN